VQRKLHQTIKRVSHDFPGALAFQYLHRGRHGTGQRDLWRGRGDCRRESSRVACSLSCSATSRCCWLRWRLIFAHELWEMTGETSNLLKAPWPKYDAALAAEDEIEIPVQVNGKLRGLVVVPAAATEDQIKEAALADEKVRAAIAASKW
jgi:leucyl-tRNA synthetase